MRIVLVSIHPYPSPQALPLANAFLKAYLSSDAILAEKVTVELCDFYVANPIDDALYAILAKEPDAVGISIYLWNREMAREIAAALRRVKPHLVIFAGGPEPTADPEGVLRDSVFDFLILGEGERPFAAAMAALGSGTGVAGINGIASEQSGEVAGSRSRPVEILDDIPSPYLAGIIDPEQYGGVLWQISRGCGFACDYCFDSQGMRGVRRFSMDRVRADLDLFAKKGVAQVFVIDSTFNQDMKRAKEILRLIATVAPRIHFHFEVRSEFIDAEMARLFARISCSLQIGLQSMHPQVHKSVSRVFNPDQFSQKVGLLNDAGAIFGFDLIYGLPGDTLEGFLASIDFALRHYPNHLDIFPLAVLPGTALAAKAASLRLRYLKTPPYTLQSSPGFSPRTMERAAEAAMACDIFYSRGKAVAWFNSLLAPLKLSPSSFLMAFRRWLKGAKGERATESALSDQDIHRLQRAFIVHLYSGNKLRRLLPAALDQIDYHFYYAAALLAVAPALPGRRDLEHLNLLDEPLILSASARLARFNYDISDLLDAGEIDLKYFTGHFMPRGSFAVIYPKGNEVFSESLDEAFFNLLGSLDGVSTPRRIASTLHIPLAKAGTLLKYFAAEGIIHR
jgi:radical SAM superfamily enzyme YgiQ (UPF0313 family)